MMARGCIGWAGLLLVSGCALSEDTRYAATATPPSTPGIAWERVERPESLGWSAARLEEARRTANALGSSAVMVVDDGRLVAAWGNTTGRWYVASMRKSLLSLLYAAPVSTRAIRLDSTLGELGIDDVTLLTPDEKRATVRDLLTSSSGVYLPSAASDTTLPARGSSGPGAAFVYNNWDFNAAGTVFNTASVGEDIFAAFGARIARPLGLEDFDPARDGRYDRIQESIHPAYHFDMTARDLARVGLMVSRYGDWNGTRIVDPVWLAQSTRAQVTTPESEGRLGYGYMWWLCTEGSALAQLGVPVGAWFANGNLNQFVMIVPDRKVVIVHRGPNGDVSWEKKAALVKAILDARQP